MKNLTEWLETVSQEEAAAKVDLKPTDVDNTDEASDEKLGGEKLTTEGNGTKHEVDLDLKKDGMDLPDDQGDQETVNFAHNDVKAKVSKEDGEQPDDESTEVNTDEDVAEVTVGEVEEGEVLPEDAESQSTDGDEAESQLTDGDETENDESVEAEQTEVTADTTEVEEQEEEPVMVDPVAEIKEDDQPESTEGDDAVDVTEEPEAEEVAPEDFDGAADGDITAEMDGVDSDIEELGVMQGSLEAFGELLRDELDKGGVITPVLAKAIQIGLESFQEPMLTEALPSLEDYSDPTGKYVVSNELMDSLKSKGKMVGKAIAEGIKRLWELLEEIYREITLNVPKLGEKNKQLEEQLKTAKDAGKGTVDIKGARKLYIGDLFAGNNPENIKKVHQVGDAFMSRYPQMFKGMIVAYKEGTRGILSDKSAAISVNAMMAAFMDNFKPEQLGLKPIDRSKVPSSFSNYAGTAASEALLGNRRFFAGLNNTRMVVKDNTGAEVPSSAAENAVVSLGNAFKLEFGHEMNIRASAEDDIIKLPDVATLRRMAGETSVLIKHLEQYAKASKQFNDIRRDLDATTAKLHGLDNLNYGEVNKLYYVSRGLAKAVTVPSGHFVGYVANLVRVLQAFITYCINAHAEADKPVATA